MDRRILSVSKVVLFALMAVFLLVSFACEPEVKVTFQNQRNEDIKLFVAHVRDDGSIDGFVDGGMIPAQTTKTIHIIFIGDEWVKRFELRTTGGLVISSHDYRMGDLEKIGWKITVPP